ncbi:unnamed protein product [Agarophyton chilense]
MKYIGAYMLAHLGGNSSPSSSDIKKILESAGVDIDEDVLTKVMSQFEGKDITQVMEEGRSKLASVPSGGAAPASGGTAAEEAPKEEEQKEESEEEEEEEMDFDLFD